MFSIRVNWGSQSFPSYSMYTASKYSYGVDGTGQRVLDLENPPAVSPQETRTIYVQTGDKVYVMNDAGATVDSIIV